MWAAVTDLTQGTITQQVTTFGAAALVAVGAWRVVRWMRDQERADDAVRDAERADMRRREARCERNIRALLGYIAHLGAMLAAQGIEVPPPPQLEDVDG